MIALSVFFVVLFAMIGIYGAYYLLAPLFERIPRLNDTWKYILRIISALLILLIAIASVLHIVKSYTSERADEEYVDEKATLEESYNDGYDDGYLTGFNDGNSDAYERIYDLLELSRNTSMEQEPAKTEKSITAAPSEPGKSTNTAPEKTEVSEVSQPEPEKPEEPSPTKEPEPESASSTVYYTESGEVYHKSKDCSYLKKAKSILSADISQISNRRACSRCVK